MVESIKIYNYNILYTILKLLVQVTVSSKFFKIIRVLNHALEYVFLQTFY